MTNSTLKYKLRCIAQLTAVVIVGFGFAACSKSMSDYVGISKRSPDETQVTTNRPLSVPPDYALRPPTDAPKQIQPGPYIPPENQPLSAPPKNQLAPAQRPASLNGAQPIAPLPSQPAPAQRPASLNGARPIAPLPSQLKRQQAIRERAAAQAAAAQARPVTTASAPQQNAPTALGQPGQPVTTQPSKPARRPTQAEYDEKLEQARKDDIARRKAKNPNYGTWRNVWKTIWD